MPALANPQQKRMRDSVARMLAHLTIGLGMTTAAAMFEKPALGQSCDRCAGVSSPSCGCEPANRAPSGPKQCSCKCVPKPSFGEKLLGHFDKLGDRIEANAKNRSTASKCRCGQVAKSFASGAPTCGCEGSAPNCGCEGSEPTCGCEVGSVADMGPAMVPAIQPQYVPSQIPSVRNYSGNPSPYGNGAIIEGNGSPPVPRTMTTPLSQPHRSNPPPIVPKHTTPSLPMPPAVEPIAPRQTKPNNLKPTPMDPAPEVPKQPKTNPKPSNDSNMPDVLVDPFKDDASIRVKKQKVEGILLTGGRRSSNPSPKSNSLLIAPTQRANDSSLELDAQPTFSMPASLTPLQKQSPSSIDSTLQFEASTPTVGEPSKVVSSSYVEVVPVKVARKVANVIESSDASQAPQVSRTRVPQKR